VRADQIDEWVRATNAVYDLNRIYVGQEVSLLVDTQSSTLRHMALEIDPVHRLVAEREDSRVVARRQPIPLDRRLRVRTGTIRTNLYAAGLAAGVPEDIISDIADLFGWELNLSRDLQPGATFRVIYEELSRSDGSQPISAKVLAAEITNRGRTHEVFHFTGSNGKDNGYYTRDGESLGSTFLRYPVAFHRITSGFTSRRFHPVLKRPVPHNGVDFAAPHGTPVKAIADGIVREARWSGGNGRFIRIRHGAIYESGYAHLSRFASGVRPGARVEKGQVIGYVGATGLATGPHLHFAMYRNGTYVNPLTTQLPRAKALSGAALAAFRTAVDDLDLAYTQASTVPEYAQVAAVAITD
jgi:murein DD-endopeptidase MepM/ murein hydrolase activator NlpD